MLTTSCRQREAASQKQEESKRAAKDSVAATREARERLLAASPSNLSKLHGSGAMGEDGEWDRLQNGNAHWQQRVHDQYWASTRPLCCVACSSKQTRQGCCNMSRFLHMVEDVTQRVLALHLLVTSLLRRVSWHKHRGLEPGLLCPAFLLRHPLCPHHHGQPRCQACSPTPQASAATATHPAWPAQLFQCSPAGRAAQGGH
jgi:hypothetical protein